MLLLIVGGPARADAAGPDSSAWVRNNGSSVRLVAGGTGSRPGELLAGLQITLDPGSITYWRNPGEAGVAPTFDTSASENVAAVAVQYPAPQSMDEAGSKTFGYAHGVTFPIRVMRQDKPGPTILAVTIDYAVCAAQCLPAKASLRLALPGTVAPEDADLVAGALAKVPRPTALGQPGPLSIDRVVSGPAGASHPLTVETHAGRDAILFVEAPEGWYIEAGQPSPGGQGKMDFPLDLLQRPQGSGATSLPLTLTLVDGARAIDTHAEAQLLAPRN